MEMRLGSRMDDRYRTAAETRIVDILLGGRLGRELHAGRRHEATTSTAATLDNLISLGLGYRVSEKGERLFDPVEVINTMKWAGLNRLDSFWVDHFVATGRALLRDWDKTAAHEGGHSRSGRRTPARFKVMLRRRFDLQQLKRGSKIRLRLPTPLSGWAIGEIGVSSIVSNDLSADVTRSDGRLDVQLEVPTDPIVEIAAEFSFTATGAPTDARRGGLDPKRPSLPSSQGRSHSRFTPHSGACRRTKRARENSAENRHRALALRDRRIELRNGALRSG